MSRDAGMDAAASVGLAAAISEWKSQDLISLDLGDTRHFVAGAAGQPSAIVTVTRLSDQVYWVVSEVTGPTGRRRQNLVLGLAVPLLDSTPPFLAAGDLRISGGAIVEADTGACGGTAKAFALPPAAVLEQGSIAPNSFLRTAAAADSSYMDDLGGVSLAALVADPDHRIPPGTSGPPPIGLTHVAGDFIMTAGTGRGVLVVEGTLTMLAGASFSGLIVARRGFAATGAATVAGAIRVGGRSGPSPVTDLGSEFLFRPSPCAAQVQVRASLRPEAVRGRRWAELF